MPLVRISLQHGRPADVRRAIADAVHQAMMDTIGVPADGRFQLINEHRPEDFIFDPNYRGVARSSGLVIVQIVLNTGRSVEIKKALYGRIADLLHERAGVRREDVLISLTETSRENWSFGNGEATYAT